MTEKQIGPEAASGGLLPAYGHAYGHRCGLLAALLACAGCIARGPLVDRSVAGADARTDEAAGAGGEAAPGDGAGSGDDAQPDTDLPADDGNGDSLAPGDATAPRSPPQLATLTSALADFDTVVTATWNVPDLADRYLLVSVAGSGYAIADAVTWQGQALAKLVEESSWPPVQQWGLVNPAAGAGDLVTSFADPANAVIAATLFTGVDQIAPIGASVHAYGVEMTNLGGSVAIVSGPTDLVVDVICTDLSTGRHTPAAGQMQILQQEATDGEWVSLSLRQNASIMSWTWPDVAATYPGWSLAATPLRAVD